MTKRKLRFNAVDAILIFAVAAVLFVLLYIFVFDKDSGQTAETPSEKIQYTILVQNLDESYVNIVKAGQPVTDAIKKKSIGTVAGVQVSEMIQAAIDYEAEKEVYSVVEGQINLKITIEAQAQITDQQISVDGCVIRVGNQYSLMLPDIYCVGYCIDINDNLD